MPICGHCDCILIVIVYLSEKFVSKHFHLRSKLLKNTNTYIDLHTLYIAIYVHACSCEIE